MEAQQFDIVFKNNGKVTLSIFEPVNVTDTPIILILPAMGVKAKYYRDFAIALQEKGMLVVSSDLRGLGLSSVRPSKQVDFGYLDMITDLKTIVDTLKHKYPNRKIVALGHSLGGQIASLSQAKFPNLLDGIILVAANSVYYKGWEGKQRYLNLFGYYFFPFLGQIFGYFPGNKVGFGGKAAKTQVLDWSHVAKKGFFKLNGDDLDYESALKQVKIPILAIYIEGDWMSPKKAMAHLYQKFHPNTPIRKFTLTKAATGTKLNHFNWVKHPHLIAKEINDWISL